MKNPLLLLLLLVKLVLFPNAANANTYYVSPTGSDSNPGTITAPFATCEKLSSVLKAGDIAYVRGGTYRVNKSASSSNLWTIQNLNGTSSNPIIIAAYQGEYPVLNLDNVSWTASGVFGLIVSNCSYLQIKGIRVTGLAQNSSGNATALWYISTCNNITIENCEADHGMYGFQIKNTNNSLFLNCDAHHLQDPYTSPAYEGSNGFDVTGTNTSNNLTFRGCRAWWVCDDGFDLFNNGGNVGFVSFENCWSFWNGYIPGTFNKAGNGWGFKLGPNATDQSNTYLRSVTNCMAFQNRTGGYDQNSGRCIIHLYNNTSWKNGSTGFNFCSTINQTIPFVLRNNVSFQDPSPTCSTPAWVQSNNSWNNMTPTASSFASLDTTGVSGKRPFDGSLPNISFLHLTSGSNLIDKGMNVSLSYNGSAPDLGAWEYGGTSPVNQLPTANAGPDQSLALPLSSITLAGTGTDPDGTITTYQWRKVSGPTQLSILSPNLAQTVLNSLTQGIYQFELQVTDNSGGSDKDTVQVTIAAAPPVNQAPTANAGLNINITLPTNSISVSGSGSDPDGTIASYQWTKIAGPTQYAIASATNAQTTISGLVQGVYQFELKVTDNSGASGKDTIQITVNAAAPPPNQSPTANAGSAINITLPTNTVTLKGSGNDPDGSISSYQWAKISGPTQFAIASATQAQTAVNNLVAGVYTFELTVTDNQGATGKASVTVTVSAAPNQLPTADAGTDLTITLPVNSVTLNGIGIDPDGTIVSNQWTKITGPGQYAIVSAAKAKTIVNNLVEGVYEFQLQVTDNSGATAIDIVQVTVNAAIPQPNQDPIANAGPDLNVTLPVNNVTLNGSATDPDGTISSDQWTVISGPAQYSITSPTQPRTSVNNLVAGTYVFELSVTDNDGAVSNDMVQVTVNAAAPPPNQTPTANAGLDINITLPTNSLTLSGSGNDADGTISSYQWTKISGPGQFTIVSATQAQTTVSNLVQGIYTFELAVTDNSGAVGKDIVQVNVNAAPPPPNQSPTANAGSDITITLPTNSVSFSGSGNDPDGTIIAYRWVKITGPGQYNIGSSTNAQTTVTNLIQGVYTFELRVTDNTGATGRDTITVTVNSAANQLPTANAGNDLTITLPVNSVSLNGTANDPDGTIVSYQWTNISGPAQFNITTDNQAQTIVNNLVEGVYVFQLNVTDNSGAVATDIVQVTVNAPAPPSNQAPSANAGLDLNITLPTNSVTLSGSGNDPDGTISSYQWTKISGPTQFGITSPTQAQTTITNLVQGVYSFELTVTDNAGAIAKDIVQVTVNAAPNQPPTADAGSDIFITLPVNSATLDGAGTDADGSIASYKWTKISGPSQYSLVFSTRARTTVSGLREGVYQFELRVTDNTGATARDTVQVTVNAAQVQPNQLPTANAGPDIDITLPVNNATLNGSGSDIDGTIGSFRWVMASGPLQYSIKSPTQARTTINSMVEGVYRFVLRVTDNSGAVATDTVQVTVHAAAPPPNQAPTANAGLNINITLPTNTVTLSGTGNDADGTITSYQWAQISGPAQFTIVAAGQAQTSVTDLVQGVYSFELTVTDNSGATGKDVVQVTVNAAAPPANQPPTANAGNDIVLTLPVNSTSLTGSGNDPDGTISSYLWTKISGPAQFNIASASQNQASVSNLVQGVYKFELKVTDNSGATGRDTVQVTVNATAPPSNLAPVANAGLDLNITLPTNSVTLSGSGTDADGTIVSYAWAKISGPSQFTISAAGQAQTAVGNLTEGVYEFELTVTDNAGATAKDIVRVTVNAIVIIANKSPTANAGPDINIILPINSTTLTGSGTDPDGRIVSYAWAMISGPTQNSIATPTQAETIVSNLTAGTYRYELTVTDDSGARAKDTVDVIVEEQAKSSAKIYPNPATTTINIQIKSVIKTNTTGIRIYDNKGLLVYHEDFLRTQQVMVKKIDITKLMPGFYFVEMQTDSGNIIPLKFVKY